MLIFQQSQIEFTYVQNDIFSSRVNIFYDTPVHTGRWRYQTTNINTRGYDF